MLLSKTQSHFGEWKCLPKGRACPAKGPWRRGGGAAGGVRVDAAAGVPPLCEGGRGTDQSHLLAVDGQDSGTRALWACFLLSGGAVHLGAAEGAGEGTPTRSPGQDGGGLSVCSQRSWGGGSVEPKLAPLPLPASPRQRWGRVTAAAGSGEVSHRPAERVLPADSCAAGFVGNYVIYEAPARPRLSQPGCVVTRQGLAEPGVGTASAPGGGPRRAGEGPLRL